MRKILGKRQRQLLAEFFNQMAVATIAGGGITALIDKSLSALLAISQFAIFLIVGILFLITSLLIGK